MVFDYRWYSSNQRGTGNILLLLPQSTFSLDKPLLQLILQGSKSLPGRECMKLAHQTFETLRQDKVSELPMFKDQVRCRLQLALFALADLI